MFKRTSLFIVMAVFVATSASAWWHNDWQFRRNVNITNNGAVLTYFQVELDVDYDSDMKADYGDVRFIASNDTAVLDYWIESTDGTNGAVIWVKIPRIDSGNSTNIWMYYGNANSNTTSDIHDTFLFGDDFENGSWTTSHWTEVRGDWSVVNGHYHGERFSSPVDGYCLTSDVGSTDYVVESKIRHPGTLGSCVSILGRGSSNPPNQYYELEIDENNMQIYRFDGPSPDYTSLDNGWAGGPPQAGTWYELSLSFHGNNLDGECLDNGATLSATDSNYTSGYCGVMVHNQAGDFDDFRVRKYAAAMPTGNFGDEEDPTNVESRSLGEIKVTFK
ncbi:MAG: DUF2341 domain-containing protein [bacterium]|nr:DUF2341 domain-containing protein [bacterium]